MYANLEKTSKPLNRSFPGPLICSVRLNHISISEIQLEIHFRRAFGTLVFLHQNQTARSYWTAPIAQLVTRKTLIIVRFIIGTVQFIVRLRIGNCYLEFQKWSLLKSSQYFVFVFFSVL